MRDAHKRLASTTAHPKRRSRILLACVLAWSLVVGVALWWLLTTYTGPSILVVQEGDSTQQALTQKLRGWFKTDFGLLRIYPWILFGPYAALIVAYFPVERGRLRLSVPVNLAGCAAFVTVCHLINAHTSLAGATVVVFNSAQATAGSAVQRGTNSLQMEMTRIQDGLVLRREIATGFKANNLSNDAAGPKEKAGLTDTALYQIHRSFGSPMAPPELPKLAVWPALMDLLAYGAIAALAHSVLFYRRFREREHRALFLESNLAHARLGALRAQLQPHFLFNSLNAVATLLRRDPRLAEAMLMSLSELLRVALSQSDRQEVSLREELRFVQRYLEIQQIRFGDMLRVEEHVDPAVLDCLVPTLLLQPLVENAIRHGIEPADKGGLVRISARRENGSLFLTVEDDGVGLPSLALGVATSDHAIAVSSSSVMTLTDEPPLARSSGGTGIGLANLRARLETLYGVRQNLELIRRAEGGVSVRIEIPCRPANSSAMPDALGHSL